MNRIIIAIRILRAYIYTIILCILLGAIVRNIL
jgi:hypothetical protein